MEDDIYGVVPCSSLAVESILRVGTAGAIWGMCIGPYDANQQSLSGINKASYVVNGLIAGAVAGAAVSVGTRSYTQAIGMASLVSAICAAADHARSS
ncbi:hypothetical protein AAHE18_12G202900 [Arachis hypogaea]